MQPQHFASHLITQQDSAAGEYLRGAAGGPLDVLIVLGSGLAEALDGAEAWGQPIAAFPLSSVPGLVAPVADGHVNELRLYEHEADDDHRLRIAVALGRTHLYEGMGPGPVTALARAAVAAGASTAILCNANGCLREWELGDVMAITDHANLTGTSPFDGTIFLDTSACWDADLAVALGAVTQRSGTYALLRGPEYQTPLETRLLAKAGVDAVGMSTVMEALMLHALGVRVCGMSVVSDLSFADAPTDPGAVVEAAAQAHRTVLEGIERVLSAVG